MGSEDLLNLYINVIISWVRIPFLLKTCKLVMFIYLRVSCKDKRILKKFINFFTKLRSLPIFIKPFSKREKRKFVTVLKSPHVNKTAQEQFEYRFFFKDFLVFSSKPLILFLFLKKLKNFSFSGIRIEVQGLFE